jgi:glutamate-1-semialdehyde 2,1-aminomutase
MDRSEKLFEESKRVLVGGVNSPVRAMKPYPFFTVRGEGSHLYDADGREYLDYCLAYGPLLLGHAHPRVVETVREQLEKGTLYGTPTEGEIRLAELVVETLPSAEMVRFVNTGTEATMAAIRLARGITGRKKILKFEGAFHGAHDSVLVKAGSGAMTHGVPNSLGVPEETARNTLLAPFNEEKAVREALEGRDVAALLLEPVMGNVGCILPGEGYLEFLREMTEETGTLLIFDEVITGYRLGLGGAQGRFGVLPDLTTLGKVLGGGLPIGAVAGSREVMEAMAPAGKVYQAGTFNGNPLSVAAGLATLRELKEGTVYGRLERLGERMREGLEEIVGSLGIPAQVQGIASMFQVYFAEREVRDYAAALEADAGFFLRYQRGMLSRGIFLPPSQFECNFLSAAHTSEEVEETLGAAEEVLRSLR